MTKIKLVWFISGLVALVAVILILFQPNPSDLTVGKPKTEQLPAGQVILVNTMAERFGVQKGDAFQYILEILYDPDEISEIDTAHLDNAVNLEPFEIRSIKETESHLDSGTNIYQRQYELQLITGEVKHLYEFPTIVVRYQLKNAAGFSEIGINPEAVYVAPRLPDDISNLVNIICNQGDIYCRMELGFGALKPLKGEIEGATNQSNLPWILWAIGGVLAILAVTDLIMRVIPEGREKADKARKIGMDDVIYQAYCSLQKNIASGTEPKILLRQMDNILKVVLEQKERVGWLEEPNLDLVSSEIKPLVVSLFEKSQKAYGTEDMKQEEVEEAQRQLETILEFYFGEEVETWKS